MVKKNETQKKKSDLYEPNKVTFGVAAIGALTLIMLAIFLVTSV